MAIDLITGKKGIPHITPEQDAMWHKGMFGSDEDYVFNVYEKFRAEKRDNNTVRIHSGIGSLQGRFFCIGKNAYEDVTIDNGAQGMSRYDAICVVITRTEGLGLHMIELKVIKGTPRASNPTYPQIPDYDLDDASVAYMLLYYVYVHETTLMTTAVKEFKLFDETPYKRALGFKELTNDVLSFASTIKPFGFYPIKTKADDADVPSAEYQGALGYVMMDIGHGTSKVVLISKTTGTEISNTYDTTLRAWKGWQTTDEYTTEIVNGWTVIKHSDGRCEAEKTLEYTTAINVAWGSAYRTGALTLSLPQVFVGNCPRIFSADTGHNGYVISVAEPTTPNGDCTFYLGNAVSIGSQARRTHFRLYGRWK